MASEVRCEAGAVPQMWSFPLPAGGEIARSQATQAAAACTGPDALMGPVLLKPSGDATSQLVVMGRPAGEVRPGEPGWGHERLLGQTVLPALEELRARYTGQVAGLGVLAHETVFEAGKTTRWRQGRAVGGEAVSPFEIHHGHIVGGGRGPVWFWLEGASGYEPEGVADPAAGVWATSLHGLFENDELRASFLTEVARRRHKRFEPSGLVFAQAREAMFERLADAVEKHLDWEALLAIIAAGWRRASP
jgi:cobyric acid synthase